MRYFGVFHELNKLGPDLIQEIELYEGYFARNYDRILGQYPQEIEYYVSNCCVCEGKILELACGTGRILIELAKLGFQVEGIDISEEMLLELEKKMCRLGHRVRKNIAYTKADIWEYFSDEKYALVLLPATTICYFAEEMRRAVELFQKVYFMLAKGGRFVFDYRIDQNVKTQKMSNLEVKNISTEYNKEFVLYQEFDNYHSGYSIVNFYAEQINKNYTERYMTSSVKKIITEEMIEEIIRHTKFNLIRKENVKLGNGVEIRFVTLLKGEN